MSDHTINRIFLVFFICCFSLGCYALTMDISVAKDSDILGLLAIIFINGVMIKTLICTAGALTPIKKTAVYTEKVKCSFRHHWKKEFDEQGVTYGSCKCCLSRMVKQDEDSVIEIDWLWLRRKAEIIRINERSD